MAARRPGRYLAPIALLGAAAAIGLVVKDHVSPHSHTSSTGSNIGSLVQTTRGTTHRPPHHRGAKFYTVKPGDTLSAIEQHTGVSVATIERLNPGVNPSALQAGDRLRLRR